MILDIDAELCPQQSTTRDTVLHKVKVVAGRDLSRCSNPLISIFTKSDSRVSYLLDARHIRKLVYVELSNAQVASTGLKSHFPKRDA